jgi:hypothetical protein
MFRTANTYTRVWLKSPSNLFHFAIDTFQNHRPTFSRARKFFHQNYVSLSFPHHSNYMFSPSIIIRMSFPFRSSKTPDTKPCQIWSIKSVLKGGCCYWSGPGAKAPVALQSLGLLYTLFSRSSHCRRQMSRRPTWRERSEQREEELNGRERVAENFA